MKTILTIGYHHYELPASANVNLILKALSGAVEMEKNWHEGNYYYTPAKDPGALQVKLVDNKFVIDGKRKIIPEHSGPEADNTF